jgi:hypothetical protein
MLEWKVSIDTHQQDRVGAKLGLEALPFERRDMDCKRDPKK